MDVQDYFQEANKLICETPFWLLYGVEAMMPMEYIMPSLCIASFTGIADYEGLEEWIT